MEMEKKYHGSNSNNSIIKYSERKGDVTWQRFPFEHRGSIGGSRLDPRHWKHPR